MQTNQENNIVEIDIKESVTSSYLDYSMSVIVGRALPDAKDGLKPVHRRILYAMHELGLTAGAGFKKSARIVGDVIGKYHPHSDTAVYDALVRLAQDFSMRLELVDGQGNFGSIDGDSAAAMRYTEARMTKASEELLRDIEKNTIDFVSNYDDTLKEPSVLPARLPNLLINGSSGIAVGMATNIPPHCLSEVIDACLHLLDDEDASVEEILQFVEGPDFPTGGIIFGRQGILEAYRGGKGKIKVRAKTHFEESKTRDSIIIDELPYQVNKAKLVEQISDLAKEKSIEGIHEVRDESDREGIRVVIELKRDAFKEVVLSHLFKKTTMETTFGIIFLALNNKEPKMFNLLELLHLFLNHRRTVVIRRSIFELEKASARAHILEGLVIALDAIDRVIALIRAAKDTEEARTSLIDAFGLTDAQVKAILEMRLQRLTNLERVKIDEEHKSLLLIIEELKEILKSTDKLNDIIRQELIELKDRFPSDRKTIIEEDYESIEMEDLIKNEPVVVTMSHRGYVKRVLLSTYDKQRRGGKGKASGATHDDDFIESFFVANTHDTIMFITNLGKIYWLKVYKIPETSRTAIGKAVVNLIKKDQHEKIMTTITTSDFSADKSLIFFTKKGVVKRTNLSHYQNMRSNGIKAISLDDDDELVSAAIIDVNDLYVFIATSKGISITFNISNVREIGRAARGVRGISFKSKDDFIVSAVIIESNDDKLLFVSEQGIGKQTVASEFRPQSRGGKGVIAMKLTNRTGNLVSVVNINDTNLDLMILTSLGNMIRIDPTTIRDTSRNTTGVKLIDLPDKEDKVIHISQCPKEEKFDEKYEEKDGDIGIEKKQGDEEEKDN